MKYGFNLPNRGPFATPDALGLIVRRAEELGYDLITTGDHILIPESISSRYPYSPRGEFPGSSGESMEMLTLLAFIAGQTQKLRLATGVLVVPHRSPLVAAKVIATLDHLSKGRVVVGIGAGWMKEEFDALGLPPFGERGAVTDEYVLAFKELWTSDHPSFEGKYCSFSGISFLPKPVQKPHPPIWVGGESPRAMRRTAELADGWYPLGGNPEFPMSTPEQLEAGIKRMARYARRAGRDPSEIEIIHRMPQLERRKNGVAGSERLSFTGSAGEIASDIRQYEAMGVGYLMTDFFRSSPTLEQGMEGMEALATQVWPLV